MMKKMLGIISSSIPDETPSNPVSNWINEQFDVLFPGIEEMGLLRRIAVSEANRDPNGVLEMLVGFHNGIGDFVNDLIASEQLIQTIECLAVTDDAPMSDKPEAEDDDTDATQPE